MHPNAETNPRISQKAEILFPGININTQLSGKFNCEFG
jgi:hypothetical protein